MNPNLQDAQRYEQLAKQDPQNSAFWLKTAHRMRTKFRNFVPDDAKECTARVERGITPHKRLAVDDDVYRLHTPYDKSKHEKFYCENSKLLNQIKQKRTFVANDLPNTRKAYRYICYFVQEGYTVKRNVKKYSKGKYYLYTLTPLTKEG